MFAICQNERVRCFIIIITITIITITIITITIITITITITG
jgi:hypothetical protein